MLGPEHGRMCERRIRNAKTCDCKPINKDSKEQETQKKEN